MFSAISKKLSPSAGGRKFVSDTLWNIGAMAIVALSGLLFNAVILRYRGAAVLAVFNIAYTIYLLVSQLAVGGVHASVLSYASRRAGNPRCCNTILRSALLLSLLLAVAVASLCALLLPLVSLGYGSEVMHGVIAVLPGLIIFSIDKVLQMYMNAMRYMRMLAIVQALRGIAILAWVCGVLLAGLPSRWLPWAFTAAEVPVLLVSALLISAGCPLVSNWRLDASMVAWIKRHWSFGWRGCLSGVLVSANGHLDVMLLGILCKSRPEVVGIYSFCAMYAEGFSQFIAVLRRQLDPIWGRLFAAGDVAGMEAVARNIKRVIYPLMSVAGVGLCIIFPFWLRLLRPESDWILGGWIFGLLILGYVITSPYKSFVGIMLQGNRPGSYTLLIGSTLLCNALLNVLFYVLIGASGVAAATVAALIFQSILLVIFCRKVFGVRL